MAGSVFRGDALTGRVAVITGGATGIGFEIARMFGVHGAAVALLSRNEGNLRAATDRLGNAGVRCRYLVCDVRDGQATADAVSSVADEWGTIDVLVNNHAATFHSPAITMSLRAFQTVVETDLIGTFNATRAAVPFMVDQGGGVVLSLTFSDPHRGLPGFSHAGAAKAGVVSLTSSWAREWGRHGIRVNSIAPGPVPTEGARANMLSGDAPLAGSFDPLLRHVPLGRLGTVSDIASAALFLCSDAASYITGVNLVVDGGLSLPESHSADAGR